MTAFPIVKEGWPFIGIMICVTALVATVVNVYWAILPAVVCCFFTYFFVEKRIDKTPHFGLRFNC